MTSRGLGHQEECAQPEWAPAREGPSQLRERARERARTYLC
jgi:hypothetical protein